MPCSSFLSLKLCSSPAPREYFHFMTGSWEGFRWPFPHFCGVQLQVHALLCHLCPHKAQSSPQNVPAEPERARTSTTSSWVLLPAPSSPLQLMEKTTRNQTQPMSGTCGEGREIILHLHVLEVGMCSGAMALVWWNWRKERFQSQIRSCSPCD